MIQFKYNCCLCGCKGSKYSPLSLINGRFFCYDCLLDLIDKFGVQFHSFD